MNFLEILNGKRIQEMNKLINSACAKSNQRPGTVGPDNGRKWPSRPNTNGVVRAHAHAVTTR
jgi:hypothetical protein